MVTMQDDRTDDRRIRARDAAATLLSRVTAGVAFGAIAGVGLLGGISAYTFPGVAASTGATASVSTTTSGSTSTGVQSSSTGVSSSSGSGVAVSGGS